MRLKKKNKTKKRCDEKFWKRRGKEKAEKKYFTMKHQKSSRIVKSELKEFKMKPLKRSLRGCRKRKQDKAEMAQKMPYVTNCWLNQDPIEVLGKEST